MTAGLADPAQSRAVLIGVSSYRHLPQLPAALNNVTDMRSALQRPELWGLPEECCLWLPDPESSGQVSQILRRAAQETGPNGMFLVYYAGHGLLDPDDDKLVLGMPRCDPEAPDEEGLPYEWIRRAVVAAAAHRRVVILDCCYSGRASADMGSGTSGTDAIADIAEDAGTCLLVSAPANRPSLSPPGERNTAFTGALLRLLERGRRPSPPEPVPATLSVHDIWLDVRKLLERQGFERPELRASNGGSAMPIFYNPAVRRPQTGSVLFAAPWLDDEELRQQAILVLRHNETGAVGVRITRPAAELPGSFPDPWRPLLSAPRRLFDGGPLGRDGYIVVTLLHRDANRPLRFVPIRDRLGTMVLSARPEELAAEVSDMRVFVGYLGWRAGELDEYLDAKALVPRRHNILQVFTERPENLWLAQQGAA